MEQTLTADPKPDTAAGKLPLEGLRVVDSSYMFAGPYAGAMLADLGAEVIKIEGPARRDFTRGGAFSGLLPDNRPGDDPWNQTSTYNLLNRGKKSLVVDLKTDEGREILRDLIVGADVLVENFTPRVMRGWGMDYPALKKLNPGLIHVSNTGYGHSGPYSPYPAQATSQEATHGLAAVTGYPGGLPQKAGQSYVDFVAAWACVFSALMGLRYRRRFGRGLWVDVAMYQLGCFNISEFLLDRAANGVEVERIGNRHRQFAPQGVYPCAGRDEWCALSVRDDHEWQALCTLIGAPDLAQTYADVAARRANHDAIDAAIAQWTRGRGKIDAMHELQDAGVPAGAVLDAQDLHTNPHLRARGLLERIHYPPERGLGDSRVVIGRPWRFGGFDASIRQAAPTFGQHNAEVLTQVLGQSPERVADLQARGILADRPKEPPVPTELTLDQLVKIGRFAYWNPEYRQELQAIRS